MAALALLVLALLLALHLVMTGVRARGFSVPKPGIRGEAPAEFRWPGIESSRWRLFRSGAPVAPKAGTGSLAARYRLAGVFVMLSGSGESGGSCAILDDTQTKQQLLATEKATMSSWPTARARKPSIWPPAPSATPAIGGAPPT